jgi:hypothetical protein
MSFISVNVSVNFEDSWFIECKFDGCTVVGDPGGPWGFGQILLRLVLGFVNKSREVSLFLKYCFVVPHLATFIFNFYFNVTASKLLTSIQYTVPGFEPTTNWS